MIAPNVDVRHRPTPTGTETLVNQARTNTLTNFTYRFDEVFMKALIGRMDQDQEIFTRIMDDPEFSKVVEDYLRRKVYKTLNQEPAPVGG